MKRFILVLVLAAIIATGTAFAGDPRPSGLGIGAVWGPGGGWQGGSVGYGNVALALKLPSIPPYLGISLRLGDGLGIGATADWNFLGGDIVPILGWYIDVGGYAGIWLGDDSFRVNFGARLPLGLTIKLADIIDIFIAVVPSIGLDLRASGDHGDRLALGGGWAGNLGIRIWL